MMRYLISGNRLLCYILSIFCFVSTNTHAGEIFPNNCKPLVVKGELLVLPTGLPRLIMLHNLSSVDVWITHPMSGKDSNAGWSSRLQSNHWSALMINKKAFELSCIESKPGHEQQIACEQTLAACEWIPTSKPEYAKGVFWAGENMPLKALIAYINRHGFELPQRP